MQQAAVQVTVLEYVEGFFKKFAARAYGKTAAANARAGADTLLGMLKLVVSKGGKDELRIALHCFKDHLQTAANSAAPARNQQVEELFALLAALVDAAERLRQFSPVKETLSCCVLEEVRWRLFRILAGDGFADDVELRRRALDLAFAAYMREAATERASLQRQSKLAGGAAGPAAGNTGRGRAGGLHRSKAPLTGPDISCWEGLWHSLAAMPGKKMMPLLQSVMLDLYVGKAILGSPAASALAAAAAAAAAPATAHGSVNGGSCSSSKSSSSNGSVSAAPVQQQQHVTEPAVQHDQPQKQQPDQLQLKVPKQGPKLEHVTATVVADADGGMHDDSPCATAVAGHNGGGQCDADSCNACAASPRPLLSTVGDAAACHNQQQQQEAGGGRPSPPGSCHASDDADDDADAADAAAGGVGAGGGTSSGLRSLVSVLKSAAAGNAGTSCTTSGGGSSATAPKQWIPKSWVQFHNNMKERAAAATSSSHQHQQPDDGSTQHDNDGSAALDVPAAAAAASFYDEGEPDWAAASSGGGAGAGGCSSSAGGGMLGAAVSVQPAAKT